MESFSKGQANDDDKRQVVGGGGKEKKLPLLLSYRTVFSMLMLFFWP